MFIIIKYVLKIIKKFKNVLLYIIYYWKPPKTFLKIRNTFKNTKIIEFQQTEIIKPQKKN